MTSIARVDIQALENNTVADMTGLLPSATEINREAISGNPNCDVNTLHTLCYSVMDSHCVEYYARRVDDFISELGLSASIGRKVRAELLNPVTVENKIYPNLMVEISRRMSQSVQRVSGKLAESCAQRELERANLVLDMHFSRQRGPIDLLVYHPDRTNVTGEHRVEVKNMKLRERATRGLLAGGDSLFGFFDSFEEFTEEKLGDLSQICTSRGGYVYVPPPTLSHIMTQGHNPLLTSILRPNTAFGSDMAAFVQTGRIP